MGCLILYPVFNDNNNNNGSGIKDETNLLDNLHI